MVPTGRPTTANDEPRWRRETSDVLQTGRSALTCCQRFASLTGSKQTVCAVASRPWLVTQCLSPLPALRGARLSQCAPSNGKHPLLSCSPSCTGNGMSALRLRSTVSGLRAAAGITLSRCASFRASYGGQGLDARRTLDEGGSTARRSRVGISSVIWADQSAVRLDPAIDTIISRLELLA